MALPEAGQVRTFGRGRYGRLGHGNEVHQWMPKLVEGLEGVLRSIGSGTLAIEELQLGGCRIQPAAGFALGQLLGKCPQLKKVNLVVNAPLCTAAGLEGVVRGIGGGELAIEELDREACDIQAEAGEALGQLLGKCPQLKKVDGLPSSLRHLVPQPGPGAP